MKFFILTYEHRFGTDNYLLTSERDLTEEDAIAYIGEEFEPDRDEFISIEEQTPEPIK